MLLSSLNSRAALLALSAGLLSNLALAQTYTVKLGGAVIDPRATSSDLTGTLPANPYPVLVNAVSGIQLEVQKKSTLVLSIERAFTDHWSAELVLGYPPEHDVKLRAPSPVITPTAAPYQPIANGVKAHVAADNGLVVAKVRQTAPTLFLNYTFLEASAALRPFVGLGANYTRFKATSTDVGNALYNDGPVRISLTDSIGFAAQLGAVYRIDHNWSLNASWATAAVMNHITVRTNQSEQTATYRFHPSVFTATVGYSF